MERLDSILIVEDHDSMRQLLGDFLESSFQVHTTKNSFEAMVWLTRGNVPDLIVLALKNSGDEEIHFLDNIRLSGIYGDIPVILLTGDEAKAEPAFEKVEAILNKPFDPLKLKVKMMELLKVKNPFV